MLAFLAPSLGKKAENRLAAIYCMVWALFMGLRRHNVGNDTPGYAAYFENNTAGGFEYGTVDKPFEDMEFGFWFISKVINFFTESSTVVFLLISFGIWVFISVLYRRYSQSPLLAILLFFTITVRLPITALGVMVRQDVSIIVIGIGLLIILKTGVKSVSAFFHNKVALVGGLICLFSILVHRSTGILIVFLFLLHFVRIPKVLAYVLIVGFTIFAVFFAETISQLFDMTLLIIGDNSSEMTSLLADRYADAMDAETISKGALVAWIVPSLLTVYLSKKEEINTYFFKVFIFSYCLNQLIQFSFMHDRIIALFVIVGFVGIIPYRAVKYRQFYYLYLLMALFNLYVDFKVFSSWPKDQTEIPFFFVWQ